MCRICCARQSRGFSIAVRSTFGTLVQDDLRHRCTVTHRGACHQAAAGVGGLSLGSEAVSIGRALLIRRDWFWRGIEVNGG